MNATEAGARPATFDVRVVPLGSAWQWLERGYKDLRAAPMASVSYGFAIVVASWALTAGLWRFGLLAWLPALAGGFLLIGPLLAVGLYGISRRLEEGGRSAQVSLPSLSAEVRLQLIYLGFLLMFIYLAWLRIAMLLYALFDQGHHGSLGEFTGYLLTTANGLALLAVGSVIGAAIAFLAFCVSAISIPLLLARQTDFVTAVLTSIKAVQKNPGAMSLWAWLIAILSAFGIATFFLGLLVIFPLIGYATWHAYRDLVVSD